jgi:hypothetical protein
MIVLIDWRCYQKREKNSSAANYKVVHQVHSAVLCGNLCVLCGFTFFGLNRRGKQTEDFAEDAEKGRILQQLIMIAW